MELNNKTLLIGGLIVIGIITVIFGNDNLSSAVVGGLIGYLSKDNVIKLTQKDRVEALANTLKDYNDDYNDEVDSCNQKTDTA